MEQNTEKKLTKYDRKLLARQAAEKREKRNRIISITALAAVVACIIGVAVLVPVMKRRKALGEYMKVNDISISQLEFNYYRASILSTYSQFFPYIGVDTSIPLSEQVYDLQKGLSWADFLDQQAAVSARENKAMLHDITTQGLTFDVAEKYNTYISNMKAAATTAGMSYGKYLTAQFGTAATEKNLAPIIKDDLMVTAYYDYLTKEKFAATDEDAQKEYDENKKKYDSVDYRVLEFAADVTKESSEEEIAAAMKVAKERAQEMTDKLKAGSDFETLCAEYAPEDKRADYADPETDKSLVTGATSTSSFASYTDWLFEDARTEGETTLYTDEEKNTCFVLRFEKRYLGDKVMENIKQTLTNDATSEYISKLSEEYVISDPHGHLKYLTVTE